MPWPLLLYRLRDLQGGSFASRVGVSLLHNTGTASGALLVAGQREYEDLAVRLVSTPGGWKFLRKLRRLLLLRGRDDEGRGDRHPRRRGKGGGNAEHSFDEAAGLKSKLPLFDTRATTMDLNRAFMLMSDVHDLWEDRGRREGSVAGQGQRRWRHLPHIVLTDKTLSDVRGGETYVRRG